MLWKVRLRCQALAFHESYVDFRAAQFLTSCDKTQAGATANQVGYSEQAAPEKVGSKVVNMRSTKTLSTP